MKKDIHPDYTATKVVCACGAEYAVGSTVTDMTVDICSNCHPFYTGKQKLIDTARRVEKFEEKVAKKASTTRKGKTAKKAALKEKRNTKVAIRKTETKKLGGAKRKASAAKKKAVKTEKKAEKKQEQSESTDAK